nr:uncharacterized protein LOC121113674 isoform X2 [Lepeophtheirus salmonis]
MLNMKEIGGVIKKNGKKGGSIIKTGPSTCLHICTMSKEDLGHTKDHKFSQGATLSCPFLQCGFKNSQFNFPGRFPSDFLLNHLHSNHKHRRFNGDYLDLTMIVPQVEVIGDHQKRISTGNLSGSLSNANTSSTTQTWPFIEIYSHKRYFYLEAQSYNMDGYHPELFLWLWFLGTESEEIHYRYQLNVVHGKSEYTYKGPVTSMMKAAHEIRNEGRCLVIRERVWDYMSYKLKITKH